MWIKLSIQCSNEWPPLLHDLDKVMVEHDMGLVMDIADRVLVLDFGQCIALGTPDEVQKNPDVIAAYLGSEFA